MDTSKPVKSPAVPRATILLPLALLLHQLEEWFGGFPQWTQLALGSEISSELFLAINVTGFLLFGVATVAAIYSRYMAWFATSFAALMGLNGVVHTVATIGLGSYSPGTATGLLLFIPLSIIVLRSSVKQLPRATWVISILFGILLHGMATYLAYTGSLS